MNDLGVVATLLAITTLEGFRRLPADSIILQQLGAGAWNVARERTSAGVHMLSWCIPVLLPVTLVPNREVSPQLGVRRLQCRLRARMRRTKSGLLIARALGVITLAALIAGVPLATRRFDTTGLAGSALAVLSLCALQSMLTYALLRRAGAARKGSTMASLSVLNPFSSHRAAEIVQMQVVSGVPSIAVAYALLGEARFFRQMRRAAYDALQTDQPGAHAVLTQLIGRDLLEEQLRTSPDCVPGTTFCPRCGAVFISARSDCSDCAIPLKPCSNAHAH